MFELKVTLDNLLLFVSVLIVAWQVREATKQSKLDSQIRLQDVNRELISLGFSKPELFEVLKDGKNVDPTAELYYLQLWLNQFCMFDALSKSGNLKADVRESLEIDFRDMMGMENVRRHWKKFGKFYPASFQELVHDILNEAGHEVTDEKAEEPKR
jgi:hypothetical protein